MENCHSTGRGTIFWERTFLGVVSNVPPTPVCHFTNTPPEQFKHVEAAAQDAGEGGKKKTP